MLYLGVYGGALPRGGGCTAGGMDCPPILGCT